MMLEKPIVDIKIEEDKNLGAGRWLTLHELTFKDPSGQERRWELCRRARRTPIPANSTTSVDAVDVIAVIKGPLEETASKSTPTHVVLVVQYRPAVKAFTVEFPSGLIDPNEEPAEAALRELAEETGFSQKAGHKIQVLKTSVPIAYEPGLTDSCSCAVLIEIEMDEKELFNSDSRQAKPEDDEWSLQVIMMPLKDLLQGLQDLQTSAGGPSKLVLDSRLYLWAIGREMSA
ncbi:hypothetical protein BGW38_001869 [Lunasporangiospora selenospora]|uniref:Nudix hydrolase domain-containing protein n=1 Tax=Lunasporangiospora selenospora TaxID=979761 RepID=A0A9P6FTI3_9FUNG|nr:hypothetical protein BGW38_001869 [Lunasporangiospora selenospora]